MELMKSSAVTKVLASFGLVTGLSSAVTAAFQQRDWAIGLLATSLLGMWVLVLKNTFNEEDHRKTVQSHVQSSDVALRTLARKEENNREAPLLLGMRSVFLTEPGIHPGFWEKYCQQLLRTSREQQGGACPILPRLSAIIDNARIGRVEVELNEAYGLIAFLAKAAGQYKGIFTKDDLKLQLDTTAREDMIDLVFASPTRDGSPKVKRLFILSPAELKGLPEPQRRLLRQQVEKQLADLRCLNSEKTVTNVGIYEGVAVGRLDSATKVNLFDFNKNQVQQWSEEFDRLWVRAEDLTLNHL